MFCSQAVVKQKTRFNASQKPNTARVLWSRKRAVMLWNVCLCAWGWEGGGLGSDRDLSVSPPPQTHPFVWMVEHSPESNAGQAGISVQISRDSPIYLSQESEGAGTRLQACHCSQHGVMTGLKQLVIIHHSNSAQLSNVVSLKKVIIKIKKNVHFTFN